jgi:lipopolysaccharide/colanic/teichoic acid biosynthesis glycosyltransferase
MNLKSRLLYSLGLVATAVAVLACHSLFYGDYDLFSGSQIKWSVGLALLMVPTAFVLNVPDEEKKYSLLSRTVLATALTQSVIAMVQTFTAEQYLPRFFVFTSFAVWPAYTFIFSRGAKVFRGRLLVKLWLYLSPNDVEQMKKTIPESEYKKYSIEGSLPLLENEDIRNDKDLLLPDVLVFNDRVTANEIFARNILHLRNHGVRLRSLTDFYEELLNKVSLDHIDMRNLTFDVREIHHLSYRRISRVLDVCFGCLLAVPFLVAVPVVSIGNLIGNRGPLFYRQVRVGQGGRDFQILKFRSMINDDASSHWTTKDDERITKFGRFLRFSHIDELPQVLNIIRGDLAVVGPRPEQPHYVEFLRAEIPFFDQRLSVRPGLTGWAQVNYPYGASVEDSRQKLAYDLFYIRHQGLGLDLRIIAQTVKQVVRLTGT